MIPQFLRFCKSLPRHLLATARHLWSYVNRKAYLAGHGAFVWPSAEILAAELGLSRASLYRHLSELERGGWLRRSVRKVGDWVRRGWELLRPSDDGADRRDEGASDLVDETSESHRRDFSETPSLYEPELNQHHTACARETEGKRPDVGGGLGQDTLHRDTTSTAQACTTPEAPQHAESRSGGGAAGRRGGAPRTADEVRAHAMWHAYEARRVRELGGKPHRGEPRYRDLGRILELVEHVERMRTDGDREAAWRAVARYGDAAIEIADWFRGTRDHDKRVWWRADGWEWSPDRFDRVMRDDDNDITGQRAERAYDERLRREAEERKREEAAFVPMSDEQWAQLMIDIAPGGKYGARAPA